MPLDQLCLTTPIVPPDKKQSGQVLLSIPSAHWTLRSLSHVFWRAASEAMDDISLFYLSTSSIQLLFLWTVVPFLRSEPKRKYSLNWILSANLRWLYSDPNPFWEGSVCMCTFTMLSNSAYGVINYDQSLYQHCTEINSLGSNGIFSVLWTYIWLNISLEHCGLIFSEKNLRHLTSRGECQEFLKNQNPIPNTCFELGTQNKWSFGSRLLPNISVYSDVEVVWPPEKSKLFKNVRHQKK